MAAAVGATSDSDTRLLLRMEALVGSAASASFLLGVPALDSLMGTLTCKVQEQSQAKPTALGMVFKAVAAACTATVKSACSKAPDMSSPKTLRVERGEVRTSSSVVAMSALVLAAVASSLKGAAESACGVSGKLELLASPTR